MVKPRALVLRSAGTNCDEETAVAAGKGGFDADVLHINRVQEQPGVLMDHQLIVVPGGFSYGDDLGGGTVFGNELRVGFGDALREFVGRGGLVLGICNGFQILVRAGLLPDPFTGGQATVTLTFNDSNRYEDRWVHLRVSSVLSAFLNESEIIELPVAHGEGKFVAINDEVLESLRLKKQLVLQYVGADGRKAGYPSNPNGSVDDVAGICDPTGRVLGLMPHPERYQDHTNHPKWTRGVRKEIPDGLKFFLNAAEYAKEKLLNA